MMKTPNQQTVGQVVAEDYRTAQVFNKFGLDFCCGGNKTIEEASATKGIDPEQIKEALDKLDLSGGRQQNYNEWSLDFLVDYIINNHHRFSRGKLPEVGEYIQKVTDVHGGRHPELKNIYREFTMMHADIINHLDKEERILFPYIKELVHAEEIGAMPNPPAFKEGVHPIDMMEQEHDEAGEAMANIRQLSDDYTLPEDACTTYRILFENLEAFEHDLHKHVHLENNILFPKALKLEHKLSNTISNKKY